MTTQPARTTAQRVSDTRRMLESEIDCWVATAGSDGAPHLVPLSFGWQAGRVMLATPERYRTVQNLLVRPELKLAFGSLRDVVLMDGRAVVSDLGDVSDVVIEEFVAHAGFDPRSYDGYALIAVEPRRILAWRGENELAGRMIMREGVWAEEST